MSILWKCNPSNWNVAFIDRWLRTMNLVDAFNKMDADTQDSFLRYHFDDC